MTTSPPSRPCSCPARASHRCRLRATAASSDLTQGAFGSNRDGVKSTGMKPYAHKMTTHQVWDVVNYLRSIGPKTGSQ